MKTELRCFLLGHPPTCFESARRYNSQKSVFFLIFGTSRMRGRPNLQKHDGYWSAYGNSATLNLVFRALQASEISILITLRMVWMGMELINISEFSNPTLVHLAPQQVLEIGSSRISRIVWVLASRKTDFVGIWCLKCGTNIFEFGILIPSVASSAGVSNPTN